MQVGGRDFSSLPSPLLLAPFCSLTVERSIISLVLHIHLSSQKAPTAATASGTPLGELAGGRAPRPRPLFLLSALLNPCSFPGREVLNASEGRGITPAGKVLLH